MYTIETQVSFDSAHFLAGYQGKCGNIHGHRWLVKVEIKSQTVEEENPQSRGMIMDFSQLKEQLKQLADQLDHSFIIEAGTLSPKTHECLVQDGFKLVEMDFRPTAENFSKWFYQELEKKGYPLSKVIVYETPNNCATYSQD